MLNLYITKTLITMKNDRITVRLTPEQFQFLKLIESNSKMDYSKIIRYLIDEKIKTIKD